MRKQIKFLFVLLFIGLFFGSVNSFTSNEEGKIIRMVEGASIRKKTETSSQGLRFYAILDEGAKNNEHGFYLAYGKADVSMLEQALLDNANNPVINGKAVYKVLVPGSDADNQYSVVLTGIPEDGYFDNISVFSYVIVEDEVFISDPLTRSIANVALKLANAGESIDYIENVDTIINTEHKHVKIKPNGDIEIITGIYELDYENLRKEFVNDWAQMFGYFISGYDHEGFYLQAKEGSNDELITNKNLSSTNIYKFFNDELLKSKWGWLLDYIIANCEIVLPSMQANAIKGDGTASGNLLFNSYHLSYSIINFFSQSHEEGDYTAIDFTDADRYATIKDYNNGVFVNLNDEVLYRSGQEITLPQPLNRKGYNFQHYLKDSETLSVGHSLVISGDEVIKAIYTPINYALKFYDGNVSLNNLNRTYTILDSFVLPEAEKDNHVFLGWYDNIDLEGEQVLKIEKGNTNEIVLYASWRTENVYSITYNLNGGAFNETPTSSFTINDEVILPVPIRDDYDFIGWYETENFTSNVVTKISVGSVNNKTYYAKWEKVSLPPSDKDFVMDAYNALDITFASGDSENSVTKNLTLPTSSIHGTTVTWNTSNSAAISAAGVVTRGNNDVIVTLTATIKLNAATEQKVFTLTVLKIEQVDPNAEYNITFNLNGGTWPKTPDIPGYTNRTTMVTDFLTDFYNFVNPSGVSKNDFIHGVGKTSGFDGLYGGETSPYFDRLYAANSKGVDPASDKFINQPQYNKWVPLLDLMEEYTALGEQGFWASPWTGQRRIVPFIQEAKPAGAWNHIPIEDVKAITGKIPEALKVATPGVQITVPSKYKSTDNDITLPEPTKTGDTFVGWYDNADLWGDKVTKITKGSMGNKIFYARYSSSVVVNPNLTDSEKLTLAKNDLNITYSSGDSATKVTKNITLKTSGLHSATITWSSSDTGTISNAGVVNRKETNKTVTLTATIKIGSLTETKTFTLTVLEKEPEVFYTITFNLNGGSFKGYKNKNEIAQAFLTDLYEFVNPSDNLNTFIHGNGKTSGFNGTWYSNDEHRNKIFGANIKSGNNNYFLSHSNYQAKWKPMADFMVSFVKVGNPDQDFWASPYTGNMRLWQYFTNVKPGAAWSDEDMNKLPSGLYIIPNYEYSEKSPTITLPTPTKDGFNFLGWYLNANFTGSKVTNIPTGSKGNKTYYAKWEVLQDPAGKTKIAGPARIPLSQAIAWANSKGAAALFIDAAKYYWEYGELTNIRPEVLFAQAAVETLYGKYGGLVKASYNNFAGIKKRYDNSDTSAAFEQFPTRKEGVRGHFNHIAAYIGQLPYGDPHGRYYAVLTTSHAGKVMYVEQLTGTWAMDPNYAPKIIGLLNEMLFFK